MFCNFLIKMFKMEAACGFLEGKDLERGRMGRAEVAHTSPSYSPAALLCQDSAQRPWRFCLLFGKSPLVQPQVNVSFWRDPHGMWKPQAGKVQLCLVNIKLFTD